MDRRQALRLIAATPLAAASLAASAQDHATLTIAPGLPMSPERMALIAAFKERSAGVEQAFEAREHKSTWTMPYRLFRPAEASPDKRLPLVMYLHGSGGLGTDNAKQMALGNIFGTRLWAMPETQRRFPCYVVAPQTDRGWAQYKVDSSGTRTELIAGFGEGSRLALELVSVLVEKFPIDPMRIYVTGQSMGGAGVWNLLAHDTAFFAAAVPVCGSPTFDDPARVVTPVWAFHGDADHTVPVETSRERIAALRKAGKHPLYTEYPGVDHNSWEWAYTEPALVEWMFAQRRGPTASRS